MKFIQSNLTVAAVLTLFLIPLSALAEPGAEIWTLKKLALELEKSTQTDVIVDKNIESKKVRIYPSAVLNNFSNLLTELSVHKFTALQTENNIEILAIKSARSSALPFSKGDEIYPEDQWVTELIRLNKTCPHRILPILRPLVPQHAHMAARSDLRAMLVSDRYSNIQRIKGIIAEIENEIDQVHSCNQRKIKRIPAE